MRCAGWPAIPIVAFGSADQINGPSGKFMKKIPSRFLPALVAVVIAATASFAVATVVEAQTPPPVPGARPPGAPPPHGERGGPHGGPGMRMMREVDQLKTSLQLNASQSALWDKAVAQMKPPTDLREQMKAHHDKMTAALADPNFDPRKIAAEMERADAERRARMATIREAWFSVYDSLNPVQRGQVREFLRERMSHMHGGHRMEWMHHREGGGHEGPHQGMMPGKPPGDGGPAR